MASIVETREGSHRAHRKFSLPALPESLKLSSNPFAEALHFCCTHCTSRWWREGPGNSGPVFPQQSACLYLSSSCKTSIVVWEIFGPSWTKLSVRGISFEDMLVNTTPFLVPSSLKLLWKTSPCCCCNCQCFVASSPFRFAGVSSSQVYLFWWHRYIQLPFAFGGSGAEWYFLPHCKVNFHQTHCLQAECAIKSVTSIRFGSRADSVAELMVLAVH